MFHLLKQIVLFFYIWFVRLSKRDWVLKALVPRCKKREIDIPDIPAALDEISPLPKNWHDNISLVGFDYEGLCIRVNAKRQSNRCRTIRLDLDIPGYGKFSHKEMVSNMTDLNNEEESCFEGKKIRIHCLDPMKRWKVQFRGPLTDMNVIGKRVHATVLLYWQCLSDPYDHLLSPSCWKLAGNLSGLSWHDIQTLSVFDRNVVYEQWGEFRGRISLETRELQVRLKSVRTRDYNMKNSNHIQTNIQQHFVLKESGLSFSQRIMSLSNKTSVYSGYVTYPFKDSYPTDLQQLREVIKDVGKLNFPQDITACNMPYQVCETLSRSCFGDQKTSFNFKLLTINDRIAFGVDFNEIGKPVEDTAQAEEKYSVGIHLEVNLRGCESQVVNLDDSACKLKYLVGGKACQLSALRSLRKVNVPKGFCITTNAYTTHMTENTALDSAAKEIDDCLKELRVDKLRQKCDNAAELFQQTKLNEKLQVLIENHLEDVFGKEECKVLKFAVRSSSVSEDCVETSAAGQMATYLCIQGLENIIVAIQRCWASSFTYPVVEYRRQNGQKLIESMGVVVQEMVDAHVSGVVFTADPVSGNESNMVINAAFGLGESVVSGSVNPDTIVVNRENEGNLHLVTLETGSKDSKIVADMGNGIRTNLNTLSERDKICIPEADIFHICETAIELEKNFGSHQDIEWAICDGKLYILQARPITALDIETDEDLLHEFDSPIAGERELITTCNIQEMMPGPVSTLTGDLFISATDRAVNYSGDSRLGIKEPVHPLRTCFTESGLSFFNATSCGVATINGIGGDNAKSNLEIHVLGQCVEEHDVNAIKDFCGRKYSTWQKAMRLFREHILLKNRDSKLFENLKHKSETFAVGGNESAEALYERIDENLIFYYEMWRAYIFKASESGIWAGIIMAILKGDAKDVSIENLADMALILSDCTNVISAEVPTAIKNLAKQIAESDFREQFLSKPTDECDPFLKNSSNDELKSDYIAFMQKHGHRGIREAEFAEKSWSQDPRQLMETIKVVVRQGTFHEKERRSKTVDEIVDSLQTKLTRFQKLILKRSFVQSAMKGVASRELGKSYVIKVTESFKRAYWRLADMMVSESRLPEQKLLFFLTHREIGELLQHRSARLVRLAKKRKRVLPEMNKIKYPKINFGLPKPIKEQNPTEEKLSNFTLQGMPVCRGKAEGRACVIKTLQDANQLEEDDVLICKFTDVGWSPYFPLISGLVTELGGLLSHGAVVARECGIPCIVNVPSATDLIQTGDKVALDGAAGTIQKL